VDDANDRDAVLHEAAGEGVRRRAAADELMLEALAAGSAYENAASAAGVSARTVRRRMTDPLFAAELARRRAVRVSDLTGQIMNLGARAVSVLGEALDAEAVGDRLRAANLILTSLRRYRADGDLELRLTALEEGTGSYAAAGAEGEM